MSGTNTTNAVQCSNCKTNNPRFFINCKKCGKKLDMMDRRVFDAEIDKKPEVSTKATPLSLLIFAIVFGTLFYFGLKLLGGKKDDSIDSIHGKFSSSTFISKVKENSAVVNADITDVNVLYIAVINDGMNKDAMATFYCRLAKESNAFEVKSVKIVDAATANFPRDGTAVGQEIGRSFCD